MIPRSRLDLLTDGVFAVAMTLMVIDLKLPESFKPTSAHELIRGLVELHTQFFVYMLSFVVLGIRWMSLARLDELGETVGKSFTLWSLAHLFFITCLPFSTMVVGRYGEFPPAHWLYAANTILGAAAAMGMMSVAQARMGVQDKFEWRMGLAVVMAMSLLAVAISLVAPRLALFPYVLNVVVPGLLRQWRKPAAT